MGKRLTNPPLISVTSSLWWHVNSSQEMESLKIYSGILYSKINNAFPLIIETDITSFKTAFANSDKYELIVETDYDDFSIISTDSNYKWESYFDTIKKNFPLAIDILTDLIAPKHIHLRLEYLDFSDLKEYGYDKNLHGFLNDLLKFSIAMPLYDKKFIDIDFEITQKEDLGNMTLRIYNGKKPDGTKGVFVKFSFDLEKLHLGEFSLGKWFNRSHEICKHYFGELISGKIKENFIYEND